MTEIDAGQICAAINATYVRGERLDAVRQLRSEIMADRGFLKTKAYTTLACGAIGQFILEDQEAQAIVDDLAATEKGR